MQPVEALQCTDIDELDHRGDHDRAERRLREVLEQRGQKEQRHDRQGGDDEARHLRVGSGGAVHRRLGQAPVHDHAAR